MVTDTEDLDGLIEELNARARAGAESGRIPLLAAMGPFVAAREARRLQKALDGLADVALDVLAFAVERLHQWRVGGG